MSTHDRDRNEDGTFEDRFEGASAGPESIGDEAHARDDIRFDRVNGDDYGDEFGEEPQFLGADREHAAEASRLELEDEDVALPWLESGEDEVEDRGDTGRIVGFVLAGLAALGLIVGGIWWATNRTTDPALVADGSTIPAPEGPYKEAPKDPGGKTFDGTGDSSFAVSEGQTRPAALGENAAASGAASPRPSVDVGTGTATAAAGTASAGAAQTAAAGNTGGVGVQVGAYFTAAAAEAGWSKLQAQNSLLAGLRHRVIEGSADIGTVHRLQAVTADAGAAKALCAKLKSSGVNCQVKN